MLFKIWQKLWIILLEKRACTYMGLIQLEEDPPCCLQRRGEMKSHQIKTGISGGWGPWISPLSIPRLRGTEHTPDSERVPQRSEMVIKSAKDLQPAHTYWLKYKIPYTHNPYSGPLLNVIISPAAVICGGPHWLKLVETAYSHLTSRTQ